MVQRYKLNFDLKDKLNFDL